MTFELQHTDTASDARTGLITTAHGQIKTPIFMPVGTAGAVKGVHFQELREQVKAQIILGNTYQTATMLLNTFTSVYIPDILLTPSLWVVNA